MKKPDKTNLIYTVLAVVLVSLFLFFSYARTFDEFEYNLLDLRYKLRPDQPVDKDIVIIEIGDDSIEKLGKWPFPRNYHAIMVKALRSAGAKMVIFDIFFSEKEPYDGEFADAIKAEGEVYLPYVFDLDLVNPDKTYLHARGYAAPLLEVLDEAAKGKGFINIIPDGDGKVRHLPPFMGYEGKMRSHLTFRASLDHIGSSFEEIVIIPGKKIVVSEDLTIPLNRHSEMLIDYPAPWGKAFRHYSYVDVMQSYLADLTRAEPAVDLAELKDAVCLIGLTATASLDAHPSPMEPLYPGVGVHASLLNSILHKKFLIRLNRWWNLFILVLMWFITGFVTLKIRKRFAVLSIFLLLFAYAAAAMVFFWPFGIWVDMFYPMLTMMGIYVAFTFRKYVAETQRRELMEKELDIAKDIQQSFLPVDIPKIGNLDVAVKMLTARQVGGDLYDVVKLGEGRLGIMMGDVSGKGVPAALFMARVVSEFKTFINQGSPAEVLKSLNERLAAENVSGLFVTLAYMVIDINSGIIEYASGGHMPGILVAPDGNVEPIEVAEGLPIGMIEGNFSLTKLTYKTGSLLFLYTDGVTEAMNMNDDMYGYDRLVKLLKGLKDLPAQDAVDWVLTSVEKFAGRAKQHDDITVMAIKT